MSENNSGNIKKEREEVLNSYKVYLFCGRIEYRAYQISNSVILSQPMRYAWQYTHACVHHHQHHHNYYYFFLNTLPLSLWRPPPFKGKPWEERSSVPSRKWFLDSHFPLRGRRLTSSLWFSFFFFYLPSNLTYQMGVTTTTTITYILHNTFNT